MKKYLFFNLAVDLLFIVFCTSLAFTSNVATANDVLSSNELLACSSSDPLVDSKVDNFKDWVWGQIGQFTEAYWNGNRSKTIVEQTESGFESLLKTEDYDKCEHPGFFGLWDRSYRCSVVRFSWSFFKNQLDMSIMMQNLAEQTILAGKWRDHAQKSLMCAIQRAQVTLGDSDIQKQSLFKISVDLTSDRIAPDNIPDFEGFVNATELNRVKDRYKYLKAITNKIVDFESSMNRTFAKYYEERVRSEFCEGQKTEYKKTFCLVSNLKQFLINDLRREVRTLQEQFEVFLFDQIMNELEAYTPK